MRGKSHVQTLTIIVLGAFTVALIYYDFSFESSSSQSKQDFLQHRPLTGGSKYNEELRLKMQVELAAVQHQLMERATIPPAPPRKRLANEPNAAVGPASSVETPHPAPTPTGAPTAAPTTCEDTQPACASWAQNGECQKNAAFMMQGCKRSCGGCPAGTGGAGTHTEWRTVDGALIPVAVDDFGVPVSSALRKNWSYVPEEEEEEIDPYDVSACVDPQGHPGNCSCLAMHRERDWTEKGPINQPRVNTILLWHETWIPEAFTDPMRISRCPQCQFVTDKSLLGAASAVVYSIPELGYSQIDQVT